MYIYLIIKNNLRNLLLLFVFFSTILLLFNICFPHEVFAMAPPKDYVEDFYGYKEYIGKDAYDHFNNPSKSYSSSTVNSNTSLSTQNNYGKQSSNYESDLFKARNPDYIIPDKPLDQIDPPKAGHFELEGKSIDKRLIPKPNHYELDAKPSNHASQYPHEHTELHYKPKIYELDAEYYEGSISTGEDFYTWDRRQDFAREFIKDYELVIPKHSMFSSLSLGIKTVNDNIVFIYLKCHEIGRRKVLWNIWEKNRGKYESYKHFKRSWDKNTDIWSKIEKDIRDDIKAEVEDLLGIRKIKKDLKKSVRAEVEKLLRDTRPFNK